MVEFGFVACTLMLSLAMWLRGRHPRRTPSQASFEAALAKDVRAGRLTLEQAEALRSVWRG